MDHSCHFDIEENRGKKTDNCDEEFCQISSGEWETCKYGRCYKDFVKVREKNKLAKAQKISGSIYKWLNTAYGNNFPVLTKNGVKSQITKIIKKEL